MLLGGIRLQPALLRLMVSGAEGGMPRSHQAHARPRVSSQANQPYESILERRSINHHRKFEVLYYVCARLLSGGGSERDGPAATESTVWSAT